MFGGQESALDVDRHHPVPVGLGGLSYARFDADPGVVHQHIQMPESGSNALHQGNHTGLAGHIGCNEFNGGVGRRLQIGADHGGLVLKEPGGDGGTNILRGTGDQYDPRPVHE